MAKDINLKYRVKAEVLTPLSIGQGAEKDWVRGVDYIVKDGVCYHLSMKAMACAGIDMNKVSSLFVLGKANEVASLIGNKLAQVSDKQYAWPCETDNPIKTFLRNDLTDHPVLAGSSLKGAIRSVLFKELFDNRDEIDPRTGQRRKSNELNERTFGKMQDGTDFMRFVRVGDFEFENTGLIATKIYNLHTEGHNWVGGWKHSKKSTSKSYNPLGFNTIYESLLPGAVAEGNMMFAKMLFDRIPIPQKPAPKKKSEIMSSPATALCDVINDHTFAYLGKEKEFFKTYDQGVGSSKIRDAIDALMDAIGECEANECVIKMSAGSGFHSITGDWQFDDYRIDHVVSNPLTHKTLKSIGVDRNGNETTSAKSRKIVISGSKPFSLMGFVKLTFEQQF